MGATSSKYHKNDATTMEEGRGTYRPIKQHNGFADDVRYDKEKRAIYYNHNGFIKTYPNSSIAKMEHANPEDYKDAKVIYIALDTSENGPGIRQLDICREISEHSSYRGDNSYLVNLSLYGNFDINFGDEKSPYNGVSAFINYVIEKLGIDLALICFYTDDDSIVYNPPTQHLNVLGVYGSVIVDFNRIDEDYSLEKIIAERIKFADKSRFPKIKVIKYVPTNNHSFENALPKFLFSRKIYRIINFTLIKESFIPYSDNYGRFSGFYGYETTEKKSSLL